MVRKKIDNLKVYEPLIGYFEHNDLGEKLSTIQPVEAEVNITKRAFIISVEGKTAKQLSQIAHDEGISSTTLLERWLKEKVAEYVQKQ